MQKKIITYFCLFTLFCIFAGAGFAQTGKTSQALSEYAGKTVSKIIVIGNEKTKDKVILREMKTKVGHALDVDLVKEDRKRIQNLLLFTRVEIYPANDNDGTVGLIVIVAERWHFFPYPLLFRNERSWELEKWSYGAGVLHDNVRGLNNKLLAEMWLGYNPGGTASFTNPWLGDDLHLYYKIGVYSMTLKSKTTQTVERFDEFHRGASFTFGKRWGYHTYTTMAVGYNYVQYPKDYQYLLQGNDNDQHLPSIGVGFQYDTRDLYQFPKDGWLLSFGATNYVNVGHATYTLLSTDVRRYIPLYKELSLALRLNTDMTYGTIPVFSHYYLGYTERIRGRFFEVMEGDSRTLFMAEFRFPILPIQYLDMDYGTPLFGQYSSDLPFGISGGLFYDLGSAWFKDVENIPSTYFSGFGFGLNFHLPYINVFRVEYAFNSEWDGQLIFDIEAAF
jgi:outer membrane protein assembly factor BamA